MPLYNVTTSPGVAVPTGSVACTLLQLAAGATRRLRMTELGVSAVSVTASDVPMLIEVLLETSAGTTPTTTITPTAVDAAEPAAFFTSFAGPYATDPTGSTVYRNFMLSPIGSTYTIQFPLGTELVLAISTKWGIRATSPQAEANVHAYVQVME
jgi:hypothetical protein